MAKLACAMPLTARTESRAMITVVLTKKRKRLRSCMGCKGTSCPVGRTGVVATACLVRDVGRALGCDLASETRSRACRARIGRVPNQVVNIILELGTTHLQLFGFLVRGEVNFFFNPLDLVIEPVILIEQMPEMIISAFEAPNCVTVFREFSEYRMMK